MVGLIPGPAGQFASSLLSVGAGLLGQSAEEEKAAELARK